MAKALEAAKDLHRNGRLDEAERKYAAVLKAAPDHADALHFLGLLKHFRGQSDEGLTLIRRALALAPYAANMHNNLGRILSEMGRPGEAEAAYRAALAWDGRHPEALSNLGALASADGREEEAEALYRRTLAADPQHGATLLRLAGLLSRAGQRQEAFALETRHLEASPESAKNLRRLVAIHAATGDREKALAAVRRLIARDPTDVTALHLQSAVSGEGVPGRASDAFVQTTFDRFADRFDDKLASLSYRAPQLVAEAAAAALGQPSKGLDILDAGCGTGLCGPYLAPFARRLVGVDLSQGMLDKAAGRPDYDELACAELTQYLAEHPLAFDAIVSADTLCYFGVLDDFAAAAASALRPGGFLAFTVEEIDRESTDDHRLALHGRYVHRRGYVEATLREAGFVVLAATAAALRKEAGAEVGGLVVSARKAP